MNKLSENSSALNIAGTLFCETAEIILGDSELERAAAPSGS